MQVHTGLAVPSRLAHLSWTATRGAEMCRSTRDSPPPARSSIAALKHCCFVCQRRLLLMG